MLSLFNLFETETGQYKVPMKIKEKEHRLNPKTNRMKNFKKTKYLFTDIPPEKRSLENLPRYANKDAKVRFQDWLQIEGKPRTSTSTTNSWGWGADGKCYGWSHRAIHGFSIDEVVKTDTIGNEGGKEYTIKTKEQCEEAAKKFARKVS